MGYDPDDLKEGRKRTMHRILAASLLLVLIAGGVILFSLPRHELDELLCPKDETPERQTILLLDTSDPLMPKHRAELERLARDLTSRDDDDERRFFVNPGEMLIVYEIEEDPSNLQPKLKVCNPGGDPENWTTEDSLTRGRILAHRNWTRFQQALTEMFPDEKRQALPKSPILENLAVIVPRHAPSRRNLPEGVRYPTHLIIFSDLLQNSDSLTHYGRYEEAAQVMKAGNLKALGTDLTRVRVSLFRLERERDAKWQTRDHYYWWTELVKTLNGHLQWQESL